MEAETGFYFMVFSYLLKYHPPGTPWARMVGAGGLTHPEAWEPVLHLRGTSPTHP